MTSGYDGRLTPTSHPLHNTLTQYLAERFIPGTRAPLPHEVRENMALAALHGVLALHTPAAGIGHHIVCEECAVQSWPPPDDNNVWAHTVYPCPTVRQIAAAYGLTSTDPKE